MLTLISAVAVMAPLVGSGAAAAAPVRADVPGAVNMVPAPPMPPPLPDNDPFYDPAAQVVAATAPGEIIAARPVRLANFSVIPLNVDAWQVSYRSNNHVGEPIAAVATLIKPRGAPKDGKPRPLLSFQSAADSLARYCDPSYVMQQGSIPWLLTGSGASGPEFLEIQAAVAQGWAVVVPDVEGPESAYAAGPLSGRITLDGIRAAENFPLLGLDGTATKVGMAGYSLGAMATNWAAELHQSYAPELNIVGAAAGGTQPDLGATLNLANGNAASGLILGAVIGLSREYPELADYLDTHLTPAGHALVNAKQRLCLTYQAALLPFTDNKALLSGGDPLQAPVVEKVLDQNRLGRHTPDMPLFQYHANMDWIAPVGPVDELVRTYCEDPNAKVTYTKDNFSEHISLALAALPSWMLWMGDRFDGVPVENGCTTHDVGSMALDQRTWPVWQQAVGDLVAGLFGAPLGK